MRIGIFSDVHGNYPALLSIWSALKSESCSSFVCLGDICGYYPMVNECIELLRENGIPALLGNHDSYLLGYSKCERSDSVNRCIAYQQSKIKPENKEWIKGLDPVLVSDRFVAMHGGIDDHLDEYTEVFDFSKAEALFPGHTLFLSGHTHIPNIQERGSRVYCNPGSVGQPRDGDPRASYAIYDSDEGVIVKRVEYDIDRIVHEVKNAGFSEYFFQSLYKGLKLGS